MNNQMMYPYQNRYPQSNGIHWVQGIEGAKAFQMLPNSNDILMDSENDGIFYIKVSDNIGMCSLRVFKYEEVQSNTTSKTPDMSNYVTKEEVASLVNEIIEEKMNEKSTISTTKRKLIAE